MNLNGNELDQPVYNSTLKLLQNLDDLKTNKKLTKITINESQLERINERVSVKLNHREAVYKDLAPVEPPQEEFEQFIKLLESENKVKSKFRSTPNLNKNNMEPPEMMELYPKDLVVKEFSEVEIDTNVRTSKLRTIKASISIINSCTENFYKWN